MCNKWFIFPLHFILAVSPLLGRVADSDLKAKNSLEDIKYVDLCSLLDSEHDVAIGSSSHSLVSPTYSPTSPAYSPTSPAYRYPHSLPVNTLPLSFDYELTRDYSQGICTFYLYMLSTALPLPILIALFSANILFAYKPISDRFYVTINIDLQYWKGCRVLAVHKHVPKSGSCKF